MRSSLLYRIRKRLRRWRRGRFPGSQQYWEDHYRDGGHSGSGSRGALAKFKARVVDDIIRKENIRSLVDFGCGDGHQLARYAFTRPGHRPLVRYLGLDVSPTAIAACRRRFAGHDHLRFAVFSGQKVAPAELSLSLDVIFHLTEDTVYEEYMERLFNTATRFVLIYSSDTDDNDGNAPHFRNRKFSDWIGERRPDWRLVRKIDNPFPYDPAQPKTTSVADFYLWGKGEEGSLAREVSTSCSQVSTRNFHVY